MINSTSFLNVFCSKCYLAIDLYLRVVIPRFVGTVTVVGAGVYSVRRETQFIK